MAFYASRKHFVSLQQSRQIGLDTPIGHYLPRLVPGEHGHTIIVSSKTPKGRVAGPKGAAVRMGLKGTTLISRMKKLGIDPSSIS